MIDKPKKPLRRGWTTGACALAATKAAYTALLTGSFPDPIGISLPKGQRPFFPLAFEGKGKGYAQVGIVKDAGDDPDVTHGALIVVTVREGAMGNGVSFQAGEGVGTVTLPGLPLAVGEPAINPRPREMIKEAVSLLAAQHGHSGNIVVEVSVPDGVGLAEKTWNGRLGIKGGLSILGTTGIVRPFSCSAWIHSIHRGIDVARANNVVHVGACTGSTSEAAVRLKYELPESSMLDMGDFVGGTLKYLRRYPIERITIGGGFAKLSKLGQGNLDLHSGRSQIDLDWLATLAIRLSAKDKAIQQIYNANTAMEVLSIALKNKIPLANLVATEARMIAMGVLSKTPVAVEVLIFDRSGELVGSANGW